MNQIERIWFIRELEMPRAPKSILLLIAAYADPQGKCFPSQSTLASKSGWSRSTVNKALSFLSRHGLILRQYNPGTSSTIKLAVDDWNELTATCSATTHPPVSPLHTKKLQLKKRKTKPTSPTCSIPKCNSLPLNGEQGKCLHHFRQDNPRSHNHAH